MDIYKVDYETPESVEPVRKTLPPPPPPRPMTIAERKIQIAPATSLPLTKVVIGVLFVIALMIIIALGVTVSIDRQKNRQLAHRLKKMELTVSDLHDQIQDLQEELEERKQCGDLQLQVLCHSKPGYHYISTSQKCMRLTEERVNFHEAKSACETNEEYMLTFNPQPGQPFSTANQIPEEWRTYAFWLGGERDSAGDFRWIGIDTGLIPLAGTESDWMSNEPNNVDGDENCLENNDGWNDQPCDSREIFFICERNLNEEMIEQF